MKDLLKKTGAFALSIFVGIGATGILSSCGQKQNEPPVKDPNEIVTPTPENPAPQDEKVAVATIVNEYFASKDFSSEFNSALVNLASKKVSVNDIKSVQLKNFEEGANGKVVLNVIYKDELNMEADELTYTGDTTKFSDFYNISKNKDTAINEVLTANNLTLASEVVKDSDAHTKLKNDFADLIADYNAEKTLFEGISAEDVIVKEDPKPVEYVSVQSIVDEVFASIDFEENMKGTMKTLISTRAPLFEAKKLFALDYSLDENGQIKFYAESINKNTKASNVSSFSINTDTTKLKDYLNISKNFDVTIKNILEENSLSLASNIEKNSSQESALREEFNALKTNYLTQKTTLESTVKNNIVTSGLISPAQFDSTKMSELGISNMNAFANALLTNDRGDGYDQVTGWTMDDVVATYVSDFSGEGISYGSTVNCLVITTKGIINYELWTQRGYGDTTDRYSMLLNNNPNTGVKTVNNIANYTNNAIIYDNDGNQTKDNEAQQFALVFDNEIIGIYDKTKEDKVRIF